MKLKGKVTVQTFDAETGKLLTEQTSHNILTKAADSLMNGCPYGLDRRTWSETGSSGIDWSPIYSTIFGGILVFPSTITENTNHLFEPLSNYPVAYGSMNGQDTSDSKTGTYSAVDSGSITGGYRYVYDFGPSQGNGTWDTVCLTSAKGGQKYFEGATTWYEGSLSRTVGIGSQQRFDGATRNHLYFGKYDNGSNKLYRYAITPYDIPLYGGNDIMGTLAEDTGITIDGYLFLDYENNEIVKITGGGTSTITVSRYDADDLTASPTTTTINLGETCPAPTGYNYLAVIRNGYLYLGAGSSTVVKKINLSNGSDITDITVPTSEVRQLGLNDWGIHATNCIIADDDSVIINSATSDYPICLTNFGVWGIFSWRSHPWSSVAVNYEARVITSYLATIFNLDNPVTKDATKTARIIYELTEVSES